MERLVISPFRRQSESLLEVPFRIRKDIESDKLGIEYVRNSLIWGNGGHFIVRFSKDGASFEYDDLKNEGRRAACSSLYPPRYPILDTAFYTRAGMFIWSFM
jgi:hypothetical protein